MVRKRVLAFAGVLCAIAAISFTAASQEKKTEKSSNIVGVYIESVQRQIDIRNLQKSYPGESAQRINPEALKADAIVGWYDKGNNFHEQKMEKNLKSLGGIRIIPETLRGVAIRGEQR